MFIDASALVAILLAEPDADRLVAKLQLSHQCTTSPLAVWETAVAVARELQVTPARATSIVDNYLTQMEIELVAVPPEAGRLALDAFDRYGKGRHPAGLNFGDCFAYACAKHMRLPLLFKGDDFTQTDIEAA